MTKNKTICQQIEQSVSIWPWVTYTIVFVYLGIVFQSPLFVGLILVLGIGNILKRIWKQSRMKGIIHHE
jgi:Sec-independent protein secretion pathway component TatC